jgi:hypothetical protein
MVSIFRKQLMSYINIFSFLEDSEGSRQKIIIEEELEYQNSLFQEMGKAYF